MVWLLAANLTLPSPLSVAQANRMLFVGADYGFEALDTLATESVCVYVCKCMCACAYVVFMYVCMYECVFMTV